MADVLSQDEINKLLSALGDGDSNLNESVTLPEKKDIDIDSIPSGYEIFDFSKGLFLPLDVLGGIDPFITQLYDACFYSVVKSYKKDFLDPFFGKRSQDYYQFIEKHCFSFDNMIKYLKNPDYLRSLCPQVSYTPLTKEFSIFGNEKFYVTLSLEALNYAVDSPIHHSFNKIRDYIFNDVFIKPIQNIISSFLDKENNEGIEYTQNMYFTLDDIPQSGDNDNWVTILLPIFCDGFQCYLSIYMKENTLYKINPSPLPLNFFSVKNYDETNKMVIRMGEKNIEDEKIKELKEGDLLNLDYTVGTDINYYLNSIKKGWGKLIQNSNTFEEIAFFVRNIDEGKSEGCDTYVSLISEEDFPRDIYLGKEISCLFQRDSFLPLIHNKKIVAYVTLEVKEDKVYYRIIKKIDNL